MPISVTEILGTDSLSGSRLVINDNFNILASEINAMEVYFNPIAGTLNNLNDIKTNSLRVGLSTVLLDINASTFNILRPVNMTGDLNLNGAGLIRNNINPQTLDETLAPTVGVGTSTAVPEYTIERVGNSSTSTLTVQLNDGSIGQEIFFIYSEATTGLVEIVGAINPIILPGGTKIELNEKGQTAHLLCIDDGTGNGEWYLVGGTGYSIS